MSTRARKDRKRAGQKLVRTPRTPTPIEDRSEIAALVPGRAGSRHEGLLVTRSTHKVERFLKARGIVARAVDWFKRLFGRSAGDAYVPPAGPRRKVRGTPQTRAAEQHARRHDPDARQWSATLVPRLYSTDPKTGKKVRTSFRNVIDEHGVLR